MSVRRSEMSHLAKLNHCLALIRFACFTVSLYS
jgi:hypothetical protein